MLNHKLFFNFPQGKKNLRVFFLRTKASRVNIFLSFIRRISSLVILFSVSLSLLLMGFEEGKHGE